MEYDYGKRPVPPPYDSQYPPVTTRPPPSSSSSTHPMYNHSSLYPKLGQSQPPTQPPPLVPHPRRHPSFPQSQPPSSSSSSSSGIGIRVAIKPEYRITPPPQMNPQMGDIPRSNFHFEFDLEKKILAEAEKENPNWGGILSGLRFENPPSRPTEPTPSLGPSQDPLVSKYLSLGFSREAVPIAVANYGDNPSKVKAFCSGYNLLREMGFSSNSVVEALFMYDNDTEKALAHFLNNPS